MRLNEFKVLVVGLAVASITLQGCGKYEDGPAFSLKSKDSRLTGEWKLLTIDGVTLDAGESIDFEFEKDSDFVFTYSYSDAGLTESYKYAGSWDWISGKEPLLLSTVELDPMTFEVKQLTSKELKLEEKDGTYIREWEFAKQ